MRDSPARASERKPALYVVADNTSPQDNTRNGSVRLYNSTDTNPCQQAPIHREKKGPAFFPPIATVSASLSPGLHLFIAGIADIKSSRC